MQHAVLKFIHRNQDSTLHSRHSEILLLSPHKAIMLCDEYIMKKTELTPTGVIVMDMK